MANYDAYRNRLLNSGMTRQQDTQRSTKRQATSYILNSPTLSYVSLDGEESTPAIASDDNLPNSKRFLFLPDTEINLGDYVYFNGNHYLATERNYDTIYPELHTELCNWTFTLEHGTIKIIERYDAKGRPIYSEMSNEVHYPCVVDNKIYSSLSNEVVALPAGAMIIKMPFVPEHLVEINYDVKVRNMEYKVTEVNYENVVNDIGYIEVNLMRAVNTYGFVE